MIRYPYMTVEEIRRYPHLIEEVPKQGGGTRFEGSTWPEVAFKCFTEKNDPVLECGPLFGMFTKLLWEKGYRKIHTVDFVNMMHFPLKGTYTYHEVDLNTERIPYPDSFFSGVTAWGICEHMENPFHFMREVHRILRTGGTFIMAIPNPLHLVSRLQFLFTGVMPRWNKRNNHIALLLPDITEKTFLRYFDLIETIYTRPGNVYVNRQKVKVGPIYLFLDRLFRYFPSNQWFGNYVIYVMRPREATPA